MSHPTSIQFPDQADLRKLKVLAALNRTRIGEQLSVLVDEDLRTHPLARIKAVLKDDPDLLNAVLQGRMGDS